jgi:hypothetical protein
VSKLIINLPDSLLRSIEALAAEEGYSVEQFIALAAAEKVAALRTVEFLREEAAKGRREDFERVLAAVPDREPDESDRMPD